MILQTSIPKLPLQEVRHPLVEQFGVQLWVLRTDLSHQEVSGNKWFKLKYNVEAAVKQDFSTLLTFGGAYSNHIYATAAAAKVYGLDSIGVIRGEEPKVWSNTLKFAQEAGMQLHFISRETYKLKTEPDFLQSLPDQFGKVYLIPEGGSNALAVKGTAEITPYINIPYTHVCCAAGTGGTLAGIVASVQGRNIEVIGFPALKNGGFLKEDIAQLLHEYNGENLPESFSLQTDYHFGGYAKTTPELIEFIKAFEADFEIPLEQVYTGKMMYGILELIAQGYFPKGSTIVAVHTGGLQGRSF
jgi:1-aminocyclopropane-1-carboxylate deaminase